MPQDQKKKKEVIINAEIGGTGTKIIGGFVVEEYNKDLAGLNGIEKYDEMRKSDAQVFATLLAMELPILATKWFIDPGKTELEDGETLTSDDDYKIANFIEKALFDNMETTFPEFLRQSLTMLTFGFSVFEKVFDMKDGMIIWKKLAPRLQRSIYKWETADGEPGVTQQLYYDRTKPTNPSIPMNKLIHFVYRREGDNPEGVSVLRSVYKHWYMKDTYYKLDAVKFERMAIGIPVITLPKGAKGKDVDEAEEILKNLRSTEQSYIVLPNSEWKFEFADIKSGTVADPDKAIEHHNREISKNILAQFLELGAAGSGGSYALSEDQSSLFLLGLTAIADYIAETFSRQAIKELVDLNFDIKPNQSYPRLTFQKIGEVDYSKLTSSLATLAGSGLLTPDRDLEARVRDMLDLPVKLEEEEDIDDTGELMEEDPMAEDQSDIDPDTEIADMESQLDALEASEVLHATGGISLQFAETVSEETKRKISEALQEYWRRKGKKTNDELRSDTNISNKTIDDMKGEVQKVKDQFKTDSQPIRDQIEQLKKMKDEAKRGKKKEFQAKIKELRSKINELKKGRDSNISPLKDLQKTAFKNRVEANKELKTRRKEIMVYIKKLRGDIEGKKMTKKEGITSIRSNIENNTEKIADMRAKMKDIDRDSPQYEAMKTLIEGIRKENSEYRKNIKSIGSEVKDIGAKGKADIQAIKDATGFNEKVRTFSENTQIPEALALSIIKKLYDRNLDATDLNSVYRRLESYVIKNNLSNLLDKVSEVTIDSIIDEMILNRANIRMDTGDVMHSFSEEDIKKLGFKDLEEAKFFKDIKQTMDFLDIINVQNAR